MRLDASLVHPPTGDRFLQQELHYQRCRAQLSYRQCPTSNGLYARQEYPSYPKHYRKPLNYSVDVLPGKPESALPKIGFRHPESSQYLGVPRLVLTGLTRLCVRPRLTWVWAIAHKFSAQRKPRGNPGAWQAIKFSGNRRSPAASISWLVKGPQAFPRRAKELEMVWYRQQ